MVKGITAYALERGERLFSDSVVADWLTERVADPATGIEATWPEPNEKGEQIVTIRVYDRQAD